MIQKYFKLFESTRSVELEQDEFIRILKDKCKEFISNPFIIQRNKEIKFGKNILKYSYIDPKKHNRNQLRSYDGSGVVGNYSLLLMDNLESWSSYPKRGGSIIGVTGARENLEFGEYVYVIIPFDGSKFGVSPHSDTWGVMNADLISFDDFFSWSFYDEGISDSSYNQMLTDLYNLYQSNNIKYETSRVGTIFKYLDKNNCSDINSMEKLLSEYFSPSKMMNFKGLKPYKLMSYDELIKINEHNEVWTDSECLVLFIKKITFTKDKSEENNIRNLFNEFIEAIKV